MSPVPSQVRGPYPATVLSWIDGITCRVLVDLGFGVSITSTLKVPGLVIPAGQAAASRNFANGVCMPGTKVSITNGGWAAKDTFSGSITLLDGADYAATILASGYATRGV